MPELRGIEFDWLATDSAGDVALFATGGNGPVPAQVCAAMELYGTVSNAIPVTGWGSEAVCKNYYLEPDGGRLVAYLERSTPWDS